MTERFKGKKALVTGAGGFIGSHLTEQLVREGATVRAFTRYTSRADSGLLNDLPKDLFNKLEIIRGDLRDSDAVARAVKGCDLVYHLGALIAIPYSYQHPKEVADVNVMGTMNMLLACRDQGVEKMIHTSTSEVYGTAVYVPIDEKHPLQGQSPYSASKIGCDHLAESFYRSFDLPVITVRPFNTFGPRQSARAVIPTIITQALAGNSLTLGNLKTSRDFTYVSDTVEGFLKASLSTDGVGMVLNLGTGTEITIGALVEMVGKLLGKALEVQLADQRMRPGKSEVHRLISDNCLAGRTIGWQPAISLEAGLDLTIQWIRENLNQFVVGKYEV